MPCKPAMLSPQNFEDDFIVIKALTELNLRDTDALDAEKNISKPEDQESSNDASSEFND